ncbi:class I SAM-dependent methyltransferase [Streptomyces sp. MAR4 CNY-716]
MPVPEGSAKNPPRERVALFGDALTEIVVRVVELWPEHEDFLTTRFDEDTFDQLRFCASLARLVRQLAGDDLDGTITDYRWMCETFLGEEEFFRRHGRYRHATFAEVADAGYLTGSYMAAYMRGLLLSQLLWTNHTRVMEVFASEFLRRRGGRGRLLEVGPGHGLLLALAAQHRIPELHGWDISEVSVEFTRRSLAALGHRDGIGLARHDITQPRQEAPFDLVVASELLEHVERPDVILRSLCRLTAPDGRIFLNVPINSPAPDHIYLWRTPEEFFAFTAECGVTALRTYTFPLTGYSEERARRSGYTLSCVVVGRPHDG